MIKLSKLRKCALLHPNVGNVLENQSICIYIYIYKYVYIIMKISQWRPLNRKYAIARVVSEPIKTKIIYFFEL